MKQLDVSLKVWIGGFIRTTNRIAMDQQMRAYEKTGLKQCWATKTDVSVYSTELLSMGVDNGSVDVAVLADADSLDDYELEALLLKVAGGAIDEVRAMGEWRLATLIALDEANGADDEKVAKLQELYADFGYRLTWKGAVFIRKLRSIQ